MTTEQLIEELKKYPGHRVLLNGYEGNYTDIDKIEGCRCIELKKTQKPWDGQYVQVPFGGFQAVILNRDLTNG